MNKTVNTFLPERDKFMPEMLLRHPMLTYTEFKQTEDSRCIYRNELDKACFQLYVAYVDFKDLLKRTVSDKAFHQKAFNTAKNTKYDGYQGGLVSMVNKSFDKKNRFTCR